MDSKKLVSTKTGEHEMFSPYIHSSNYKNVSSELPIKFALEYASASVFQPVITILQCDI